MNRFQGLSLEEMLLMKAREYEEKMADEADASGMTEALEEGVAHFRSKMEGIFEDGNGIEVVCNLFREEVSKLGEEFVRQMTKLTNIINDNYAAFSNISTLEQLGDFKRNLDDAFGETEARK